MLDMSTVIAYAGYANPERQHDFRDQGENGCGRGGPDEPARCQWHQHARRGASYRHPARLDRPPFSARQAAADRGRDRVRRQAGVGPAKASYGGSRRHRRPARIHLAVAVEQFVNEATERDGKPDEAAQARLLDLADAVFADWQHIMVSALRREGVSPARARRLAALVIASTEGTVAMCRAARSAQPLEDVRHELELVLSAAIAG